MWSHYQFSFCKSRESYQHVKDGESWALGGNREPQTNWCPWLTFVWPSIHAKSISLFQVWGRAQFEGNGAAPSRTFVAGSRWAAVRVISHSDCDPGSSSRGCTGVQPGTKPDRDCWWETGQEKGERRGNLPLCLCSLEMERVSQKKKKILISSFSDQKDYPDTARRPRWHPGHGEGQWQVSLLCSGWTPMALLFLSCLVHLQPSSDFCGRTWSQETDNMVSLEHASAFYCF